jgi:hypothetical protein
MGNEKTARQDFLDVSLLPFIVVAVHYSLITQKEQP